MIQTYYGNGKGKTTAAIGSTIRCAGCGQKVLFVSFLKNNTSSEFEILSSLELVDVLYADVIYTMFNNQNQELIPKFSKAYQDLFSKVQQQYQNYRMIVLDEVLDAISFGYLDEEKVLSFIGEQKENHEWILTGHTLTEKVCSASDYVSHVDAVKHPYNSGISSRKGIEY